MASQEEEEAQRGALLEPRLAKVGVGRIRNQISGVQLECRYTVTMEEHIGRTSDLSEIEIKRN